MGARTVDPDIWRIETASTKTTQHVGPKHDLLYHLFTAKLKKRSQPEDGIFVLRSHLFALVWDCMIKMPVDYVQVQLCLLHLRDKTAAVSMRPPAIDFKIALRHLLCAAIRNARPLAVLLATWACHEWPTLRPFRRRQWWRPFNGVLRK